MSESGYQLLLLKVPVIDVEASSQFYVSKMEVDFHLSMPGSQFDELAQRLLKGGHLSENMIHTGNDGSTFVDVIDPDGNVIKIMKR